MKFFDLLDSVEAPAFALGPSGSSDLRILFWGRRIEALTGRSRAEVLRRKAVQIFGPAAFGLSKLAGDGGSVSLPGLGTVMFRPISGGRLIGTVCDSEKGGADDEREVFLAMAAHDLRQPLRNIGFLAGVLAEEPLAPGNPDANLLEKIRVVGERALEMTNELIAGVQASTLAEGNHQEIDLAPACDVIFKTLDPLGRHDLRCQSALIIAEKPVLLIGLRNLIDNALRHGGDRARTIGVSVTHDARQDWLQIAVADNGEGFRDPALALLAGGAFRYDSGYGLSGFRRLIQARGGRIAVASSESGQGSVVSFTLPGSILPSVGGVARAV